MSPITRDRATNYRSLPVVVCQVLVLYVIYCCHDKCHFREQSHVFKSRVTAISNKLLTCDKMSSSRMQNGWSFLDIWPSLPFKVSNKAHLRKRLWSFFSSLCSDVFHCDFAFLSFLYFLLIPYWGLSFLLFFNYFSPQC